MYRYVKQRKQYLPTILETTIKVENNGSITIEKQEKKQKVVCKKM